MLDVKGRADWPSLFIFGAAVLLLTSSLLIDDAYRWGAVALLAFALLSRPVPAVNLLGGVVALFAGWLFINALLVTPGYRSEGYYRPLILLASFAIFAAIGNKTRLQLFRGGVVLLAGLVFLGLLQHFFGFWHLSHNLSRAAATFVTPNTFATAINLFLLPLVALYATRDRSPLVYGLILWLFAGLVASQSRGGMLALFAGLGFIALCAGWIGLKRMGPPVARLLVGGALVWVLVLAAAQLLSTMHGASDALGPSGDSAPLDPWLARATWDRAEIYATTLRLILERPIAGAGANMFWPLFEQVRPAIFGDKTFLFAHNDYLQFWLEYGLMGLALFVALGAVALGVARNAYRRAAVDPVPLACGAALAGCFAHAMVDFPFFIPFILFVTGGYLGALASCTGDSPWFRARRQWPGNAGQLITPLVRGVAVLAFLAWLAQPMLAQLATGRATEVLSAGSLEAGLYWLSVARRLEPRNPSHYRAEAVTWRELAIESRDRTHFARVDALLADGIHANPPYSFAIVLERARLHRRYSEFLEHPAPPAEIVSWVELALARAPSSVMGQVELARALDNAGRGDEARRLARRLLELEPGSALVRALAAEII